jgi:hypothetical protein
VVLCCTASLSLTKREMSNNPTTATPDQQQLLKARILETVGRSARRGVPITPGFLAAVQKTAADPSDPNGGLYRQAPASVELPRLDEHGHWTTLTFRAVAPSDIAESVSYACEAFGHAAQEIASPDEEERRLRAARSAGWLCARIVRISPYDTESRFTAFAALFAALACLDYSVAESELSKAVYWSKLSWASTLKERRTIGPFASYLGPLLLPYDDAEN